MAVKSGELITSKGLIVIKNGGTIAVGDDLARVRDEAFHGTTTAGHMFYTPDEWDALEEFFKTHTS